MRRCAAYVQCAAFEGHPKTIIEAMSAGAPTIVTRGPGVDDEITPGATGYITGDTPEAIAATLAHVLDHPEEAHAVGNAAARDIRTRLSLESIFPRYIEAWTSAMQISGSATSTPSAGVRWDQELLERSAFEAAQLFGASIGAYAKRLSADQRAVFAHELQGRIESVTPRLVREHGPAAIPGATSSA
jgi:hypothetical protein